MNEYRVTIKDIADELGLSTATVSNVIHGKTKKISQKTVEKVQEKIEESGYLPNMAAVLLAQNTSKIVCVVLSNDVKYENKMIQDPFVCGMLNYLSKELDKNDYFVMLKEESDINQIVRYASMWNMEGIVIIGFCNQDYMYLRNHMRIPFVVYDGYCSDIERIYNITIDNFDGGRKIGQLFKQKGYQKALYIADNDICVDRERYEGFCEGIKDAEVDFMQIPMQKELRLKFYREHLEEIKEYRAVFAASDYYAVDMMHFLQEQNIRVPKEIAVAGFDDIPLCEQVSPTLTSVRQDLALRAEIALDKLKRLREKKETETEIMLPVDVIEREST